MEHTNSPLPSFGNPPVVEVALSVQFDPISALQVPQIGLLWSEFRGILPESKIQPPLQPEFERFGVAAIAAPRVRIETFDTPPVPRLWFLNNLGTELVQVQQTRFITNWRRVKEEPYPRFQNVLQNFRQRFEIFLKFLSRENLGDLAYNQCEVTYVNHIVHETAQGTPGSVKGILTTWNQQYSDDFLPDPEDVMVRLRYIIPGDDKVPAGRLHIDLQPAWRNEDQKPIFLLNLTARGKPIGDGLDGVYKFFELGREWIVRGFTSITPHSMHQIWEREEI